MEETVPSAGVAQVSFGDTELNAFVGVAKLSSETLYVRLNPTWNALSKERRTEILQRMYQESGSIGASKVSLISDDGKIAGFASATRNDVVMY